MKYAKRIPPRVHLDPDMVTKICDYLEQQCKVIVLAYGTGATPRGNFRHGTRGGHIKDAVAAMELNQLRQWRWILRHAVIKAKSKYMGDEQSASQDDIRRVLPRHGTG